MSNTLLLAMTVAFALAASTSPAAAEQQPSEDSDRPTNAVWADRPHRVSFGGGYPYVLDIRYSFAVLPRVRAGVAFVGLAPFLFGGAIQGDYMLAGKRFDKSGFMTLSAGLQALLLKYNFGIAGIQPNDVDWGVGPELAFDVGVSWFSAGAGVSVLVGDWRSLKRDIGPDVTPGENVVLAFSFPRLSVNW